MQEAQLKRDFLNLGRGGQRSGWDSQVILLQLWSRASDSPMDISAVASRLFHYFLFSRALSFACIGSRWPCIPSRATHLLSTVLWRHLLDAHLPRHRRQGAHHHYG